MQRNQIVNRRRAHAALLRRVHPIGEVQRSEGAEPPFRCRMSDHRPRGAPPVRTGQRDELQLHVEPGERFGDHPLAGR